MNGKKEYLIIKMSNIMININNLNIKVMKIEIEFATDGEHNYPLGYIIIAENENDEKVLNTIRNMHFFADVKYAGRADSDNGNVGKLMFENPNIVMNCIGGNLKGVVCKEHLESIICSSRSDFTPRLSPKDFAALVKSQFEITD